MDGFHFKCIVSESPISGKPTAIPPPPSPHHERLIAGRAENHNRSEFPLGELIAPFCKPWHCRVPRPERKKRSTSSSRRKKLMSPILVAMINRSPIEVVLADDMILQFLYTPSSSHRNPFLNEPDLRDSAVQDVAPKTSTLRLSTRRTVFLSYVHFALISLERIFLELRRN